MTQKPLGDPSIAVTRDQIDEIKTKADATFARLEEFRNETEAELDKLEAELEKVPARNHDLGNHIPRAKEEIHQAIDAALTEREEVLP